MLVVKVASFNFVICFDAIRHRFDHFHVLLRIGRPTKFSPVSPGGPITDEIWVVNIFLRIHDEIFSIMLRSGDLAHQGITVTMFSVNQ